MGHYTAYTYVSPILLSAGVSQDALSIVLLAYGIAGVGGLVLAGALADRFPVGLLRATVLVTAAALGVVALVAQSATGVIVSVVVWGVAFSAVPTLLNAAALRASTVPDAAPAVVNAMFNVGIAAGAWLGGHALLTGGTTTVALVAALLVGLSLPLTLSGRRERAARPPAPGPVGAVSDS
ncbi:MFS transporter [Sanguibacter sp. Leaf3]|uniref:MFS transporter n=1 Tax=Sanguibacter sp. Leaf3 TaxID=1736209 RepID=UPI00138F9AED|nr:MFS transporter [Sanguibacter sp. Leaf3]